MKKGYYLFAGLALILVTILSGVMMLNSFSRGHGLTNVCNVFLIQEHCMAGAPALPLILFLIAIFLIPGIYYIRAKKKNKLTNWSVGLTFIGLILVILTFLIFFILGLISGSFEGIGWAIAILGVPFGLAPAGILYVIAIILLIINWFKTRKH